MIAINIIDDWYITANSSCFMVGKWNGKSYHPKSDILGERGQRIPFLTDGGEFDDLYDCFTFVYRKYQHQAFEDAGTSKELFNLLANITTSMKIIEEVVSGEFSKAKKEARKRKRNRG